MKVMMKRVIAVLFIAGFLVPSVLFADGRKDVDSFLKTYEEFVVSCEKAAKSNDVMAIVNMTSKGAELDTKLAKLQKSKHWTQKDTEKMLELTVRFTAVMQKMNSSTTSSQSLGL